MSVFLDGIAAQFYRGIGAEVQFIAPFSRMNFFIGANNAGKSIVLSLLAEQLSQVKTGAAPKALTGPERHTGAETGRFLLLIGRKTDTVLDILSKQHIENHTQASYSREKHREFRDQIEVVLQKIEVCGLVWTVKKDRLSSEVYPPFAIDEAKEWTSYWQKIWMNLHPGRSSGNHTHWIAQTMEAVANRVLPSLPNIYLIPAKRVLGSKGETFDDLSGKGLIDHLAALQQPNWDKQEDREKFQRINHFLREVTGKLDATLEVPHGRENLLVHMDKKVLPLSSLGTGIHEVVLIAAFCTIHDDSIMCIEEPEIHLHPLLQRKLINYLMANTNSQYFIATHSAAFIDTLGANIFRVTNDGEQTRIEAALTKGGQREILDDLGCQASDILQANAVIWVEGPSDRTYLNHWIKSADKRLLEGIHYTIMFYGGALIRHLSASDAAVDEFIKLRDLNRNMAIIIDSDRESSTADLKPHAQRLLEEMSSDGGFVWVTEGREMENYVDGARLQEALRELHPRLFVAAGKTGQYDNAFHFFRNNPKKEGRRETYKDADKVGLASKICQDEANFDILDLRERIGELTDLIRKANGIGH